MHTLIIRHLGSTGDQQCCQVWRLADGKTADEVLLTAPDAVPVGGRPDSDLSRELRWYLEEFLDYPFPPKTAVAERVQSALTAWGEQTFMALFHSGRGRDFYQEAYHAGLEQCTVKIASDDPRLLAWPWEALRDPQTGGTACTLDAHVFSGAARYCKKGARSSRPNGCWIMCFFARLKAHTSCTVCVRRFSCS